MKNIILITIVAFYWSMITAQVPLAEIEGRLSVYLPSDTTSLHIGKNSGIIQDSNDFGYNTFVGTNSGNKTTSGQFNSFFGVNAGRENIDGKFNSYYGNKAGYNNTGGSKNLALGSNSMYSAQSVSYNVSVGDSSMFFVDPSGHPEITGSYHTAIGASSLAGKINFEIENSVALGYEAGYDGGSNSIFIGHQAGKNISSFDNRLYISNREGDDPLIYGEFDNDLIRINGDFHSTGKVLLENKESIVFKKADNTEKEVLTVGSDDHTSLNAANDIIFNSGGVTAGVFRAMTIKGDNKIGIGTIIPQWRTEIRGKENALTGAGALVDISNLSTVFSKGEDINNEAIGIGFQSSSDEGNVGAAIIHERTGTSSQGSLHFATKLSATPNEDIPIRMTITDEGKVGIGMLNPTATLDVAGEINGTGLFCNYISACSDERLKKDFTSILNPISIIQQLSGYFHYWNTSDFPNKNFTLKKQIGFKAQELQEILPEVVNKTPEGYLSVEYGKLVPLLVEAIKEQQSIIEKQQVQLNKQSKEMQEIKAQLSEIKELIVAAPPKLNSSKNETGE